MRYSKELSDTLAVITRTPAISSGNLKEAAEIIAKSGALALNASRVGVWRYGAEKYILHSICTYNKERDSFDLQDDFDLSMNELYYQKINNDRLIVTDNVSTSDVWEGISCAYNPNLCAIIDVPVRIDGKLVGAVCVEQDSCTKYRKKRKWSEAEQGFASSLGDLTALAFASQERKSARDAAIAANYAKTAFLATMSHEIRTPMNSIAGFAELAADCNDILKIKDYICKINDGTRLLLRIINDILDISKVESGKMELECVPFEIKDVISRCQSVTLPSVMEKGLDLSVYVEPPYGLQLLGDPLRLYQAISNLLNNAVKFTESGRVQLIAVTRGVSEDSANMYFEVKDSGIGMTQEQLLKIFDPFVQADAGTTRNYGGSGLGLSIVKNIVELMGGTLAVETEEGKGSLFSFEIKFKATKKDLVAEELKKKTENGKRPKFNGRVLICDDNVMNRQVVCEHLWRVGLETVAVENGREAVNIIKSDGEEFNLIFMDIFMPVMDGIEAAKEIIKSGCQVPIVAMTANVMLNEIENYKKNGMGDFLGKPFSSHELWAVLEKYLQPVGVSQDESSVNDSLAAKLRVSFVKSNKNFMTALDNAIKAKDFTTARRLAHTLKGNAGMIDKTNLQTVAAELEIMFRDGKEVEEKDISFLRRELNAVLDEFEALNEENGAIGGDTVAVREIVKMLENINPDVVNHIDGLRETVGCEELIEQIENYEFENALHTINQLRLKGIIE